ncbi:hypothetical protein D9M70_604320 [compost metagenome]
MQVDTLGAQVAGIPGQVVALVELHLETAMQAASVERALGHVEAGPGGDVEVVTTLLAG